MTTALIAAILLIAAALLTVLIIVAALAWASVTTAELDEDLDPAWWMDTL